MATRGAGFVLLSALRAAWRSIVRALCVTRGAGSRALRLWLLLLASIAPYACRGELLTLAAVSRGLQRQACDPATAYAWKQSAAGQNVQASWDQSS